MPELLIYSIPGTLRLLKFSLFSDISTIGSKLYRSRLLSSFSLIVNDFTIAGTKMGSTLKLLISAVLAAIPALAHGWMLSCADLELHVETDEKREVAGICRAVKLGRDVLSRLGLDLPKKLAISFAHKPVNNELCQSKCIGFFDVRAKKIYIPDYKSATHAAEHTSIFVSEAVTPVVWDSYLVHELAHAAVQNSIVPGVPICIASEYVASVAQLEAIPAIERKKILDHYGDLQGFTADNQITVTYYLMDPARFIVNSYLHYQRPENGPAFIKRILRDGLSCDLL